MEKSTASRFVKLTLAIFAFTSAYVFATVKEQDGCKYENESTCKGDCPDNTGGGNSGKCWLHYGKKSNGQPDHDKVFCDCAKFDRSIKLREVMETKDFQVEKSGLSEILEPDASAQ